MSRLECRTRSAPRADLASRALGGPSEARAPLAIREAFLPSRRAALRTLAKNSGELDPRVSVLFSWALASSPARESPSSVTRLSAPTLELLVTAGRKSTSDDLATCPMGQPRRSCRWHICPAIEHVAVHVSSARLPAAPG